MKSGGFFLPFTPLAQRALAPLSLCSRTVPRQLLAHPWPAAGGTGGTCWAGCPRGALGL